MCSEPVTFGGGITIENTGPGAFGSALNSASFTQKSAHRGSICCGSYAFAISRAILCGSPCSGGGFVPRLFFSVLVRCFPASLCVFFSGVYLLFSRGKRQRVAAV